MPKTTTNSQKTTKRKGGPAPSAKRGRVVYAKKGKNDNYNTTHAPADNRNRLKYSIKPTLHSFDPATAAVKQAAILKELNITRNSWYQIINLKATDTRYIRAEWLRVIAAHLGCSMESLFNAERKEKEVANVA